MNTIEAITALAVERLGLSPARLQNATSLRAAGIDSLAAIDLVVAIEQHFGIAIDDAELQSAPSLQELSRIVERLIGEKSRGTDA